MLMQAEIYLQHCYDVSKIPKSFPLDDESFVAEWKSTNGRDAIEFLSKLYETEIEIQNSIKISFTQTLAGKLPVIDTEDHSDFEILATRLYKRDKEIKKLPETVNTLTIPAKIKDKKHRLILLNRAPYSNISAEKLGLDAADWIEKSHMLRLRHESAHYETLRLFGGMKNHALDEILADTLGQIYAFGNFSADRQRLFFGLHENSCDGRLQFYCRNVDNQSIIYQAVDQILDEIELEVQGKSEIEILKFIAGKSIWERCSWKKFSATKDNYYSMLDYVMKIAEKSGMIPNQLTKFELGFEEAAANVINYAYQANENGKIQLRAYCQADYFSSN